MAGEVVGEAFPAPRQPVLHLGAPVEAVAEGPMQKHQCRGAAAPMAHLQRHALADGQGFSLQPIQAGWRVGVVHAVGQTNGAQGADVLTVAPAVSSWMVLLRMPSAAKRCSARASN